VPGSLGLLQAPPAGSRAAAAPALIKGGACWLAGWLAGWLGPAAHQEALRLRRGGLRGDELTDLL